MRVLYSVIATPPAKFYGGERHHIILAKNLAKYYKDEVHILSYKVKCVEDVWSQLAVLKHSIQPDPWNYCFVHGLPLLNIIPMTLNLPSMIAQKGLWFFLKRKYNTYKCEIENLEKDPILKALLILANPYINTVGYSSRKLIQKILEEVKPEVIHVYGIQTFWLPYYLSKLAIKNNKLKLAIWTIYHPYVPFERLYLSRPKILGLLEKADLVISSTNFEKNLLSKLIMEKRRKELSNIKVLPVPIDLESMPSVTNKQIEKFKENFGNPDYIILSSTLKEDKGTFQVMKALEEITISDKVLFLIFGRSLPEEIRKFEELKRELPNNIEAIYIGYISEKLKGIVYSAADVFAMPSIADSFGIAYAEAWYYNTPVIAAKTPIMEEVIGHMRRGILVPFNNIQKLSKALEMLLEDPKLARSLALSGKKYVHNVLDAKKVVSRVRDEYLRILS